MDQATRLDILQAMGIEPMVLRSRGPAPKPVPAAAPGQPEALVTDPAPAPQILNLAPPKIELPSDPEPAPKIETPSPVETFPTLHFAALSAGDLILLVQLPSWAQGMVEQNCRGFLRDLCWLLPGAGTPDEVLSLPKSSTPSLEMYQGLLQGRLMRAQAQGAKRLLLMSDHPELASVVPGEWALYQAPGLNSLMESAQHKQALWKTLQSLSR